MYSKFGQFIDGKWQPSEKKETYEVINPATEEIIGSASKASSADVEKALNKGDRNLAGRTAPAHGLYSLKVIYPDGLVSWPPEVIDN